MYRRCQFDAWDMIAGLRAPELGGAPEFLDVVGVNYYVHNQWELAPPGEVCRMLKPTEKGYRRLSSLLRDVYERYHRPLFISETGIEGTRRPAWLRHICEQVTAARRMDVPVQGVCLYPVTDYPGWANDRHCECGLLSLPDAQGRRLVYGPLKAELARQQMLLGDLLCGHLPSQS